MKGYRETSPQADITQLSGERARITCSRGRRGHPQPVGSSAQRPAPPNPMKSSLRTAFHARIRLPV